MPKRQSCLTLLKLETIEEECLFSYSKAGHLVES